MYMYAWLYHDCGCVVDGMQWCYGSLVSIILLELTFGPCLYSSEALLCDWPVSHLDLGTESCRRKESNDCMYMYMYMLCKHLVYM